jgi:hypothetical protein
MPDQPTMRSATILLVASTLTLATVAVIACSSDTTATPTEDAGGSTSSSGSSGSTSGDPDPGTSSSSGTSGASSGTSGASSGTSGSSGSNEGGTSSSGSTYDGGGAVDGGDAGALCLGGSIQESETNNTAPEADTLPNTTTSFCGHLDPGDIDYATFTWEVGKNSSRWDTAFSASQITVEIMADGAAATFNTPPKPGKVYVLKITAAAATDYRVQIEMLP